MIYSYKDININDPFGTTLTLEDVDREKYTILCTINGRTYIEIDDDVYIPEQEAELDLQIEYENPLTIQENINTINAQLEQTEQRIEQMKNELLLAILSDDTEIQENLKAEYKELLNE